MTDTLDKTYDPSTIETRWYKFWEQNSHFEPSSERLLFHHDSTPECHRLIATCDTHSKTL